ncbi:MAG TPA: amidohydrolase family protein [Terracidiphilus sp.]|nr:amidohydrolase family protein [Terracidiphilus sp.]
MRASPISEGKHSETVSIHGARVAIGPQNSIHASIQIDRGRIAGIQSDSSCIGALQAFTGIDLAGFLVLPGLINAHDHLEFALFPRLGEPPYRNYIDWGEDIHNKFPDIIARHRAVPKDVRLWWGGIRNLLCGVTTVSHHNPLWPELRKSDFPVRTVQEYGWGHSLALGGDLRIARAATPAGRAFILHACEGVDARAREELQDLDNLGLLDASTVLVHGLAIDDDGVAKMIAHSASLIICPSSNYFLFGALPDMPSLSRIERVALGNDSPLTADGDILDEIRFAVQSCSISASVAYDMVTTTPAAILRLEHAEGSIAESGVADLIAVRDTGINAADRTQNLSMEDVEFVMIAGRTHLASESVLGKIPPSARQGLEPLSVGGVTRWLRAPVSDLLQAAEKVLGRNEVRLGSRIVSMPTFAEAKHAC